MIEFIFTDEERAAALREAHRRIEYHAARTTKHNDWNNGRSSREMQLIGAAGEMAVASYLGMKDQLNWDCPPEHASFDLPGIDVKTRRFHRYDLIVHGDERIEHKTFWLVTIEDAVTLIHGWLPGVECKQERWLRRMGERNQPNYFVPKDALNPPESWAQAQAIETWGF